MVSYEFSFISFLICILEIVQIVLVCSLVWVAKQISSSNLCNCKMRILNWMWVRLLMRLRFCSQIYTNLSFLNIIVRNIMYNGNNILKILTGFRNQKRKVYLDLNVSKIQTVKKKLIVIKSLKHPRSSTRWLFLDLDIHLVGRIKR